MTFTSCHTKFHTMLDSAYGHNEVNAMFFILSEHFLNKKRVDFALNGDYKLSGFEVLKMNQALERLQTNEPVQYITGNTYFYGFNFKVNPHTLIPRPETEELVSLVIESVKNSQFNAKELRILDVGTGSGCIAVVVSKLIKGTEVYGLDISNQALEIASENAQSNQANVTFIEADILNETEWVSHFKNLEFDVIVSNPPYVRQLEKAEMKPNVLNFEPATALFVSNESPLIFYDAIAKFASRYLRSDGLLFFEINQYLGEATKKLLEIYNFEHIELHKDFSGNDRMIKAVKPATH